MSLRRHKTSLMIATFGALLALVLSILSASQHIRISKEGFENPSYCAISEKINCDVVNASSYSEFLGYPIAWWGIAFYAMLLIISFRCLRSRKDKRPYASFGWFMAGAGLLYCIFLAYVAVAILDVICLECLGMYIGTFLVWVGLFPSMEVSVKNIPSFTANYIRAIFGKHKFGYSIKFGRQLAMLLAMLALAAITYPAFGGKSKGTPSDSYVAAHFAQSGYDIPVNPKWPVWGNPKAKVTIIEFSEFQCPYCRMSSTHFRPYLYEFRDKVRYYFVNFPLDSDCNPYARSRMHPQACVAARAAVCADRFGDFWDYHDEMFRNAKKLNKSYVLKLGEQFGWDPAEFQACMDDPSTEKWIKDDCELANKLHITGTPTIFVNNKRLRNWNDKDFVRAVIKEEIKRSY